MPRIAGMLERTMQALYDMVLAASGATQTEFNLFTVPLGGAYDDGGTLQAKTQVQTNMVYGGSMPYPQNFECHGMRLICQYGAAPATLNTIFDSSWVRFFIGTKDYLVVNSFQLTAGVGLDGVAAGTTDICSVQNGRPDQRATNVFAEVIDLIPQQNFKVTLYFPVVGAATPFIQIWIYLDGFLKREVM